MKLLTKNKRGDIVEKDITVGCGIVTNVHESKWLVTCEVIGIDEDKSLLRVLTPWGAELCCSLSNVKDVKSPEIFQLERVMDKKNE